MRNNAGYRLTTAAVVCSLLFSSTVAFPAGASETPAEDREVVEHAENGPETGLETVEDSLDTSEIEELEVPSIVPDSELSVHPEVPEPAAAASSAAPPSFPQGTTRLSGVNRYATSAAVASKFSSGVPAVFVATGQDFPDALSAAAAAANVGAPLLLTSRDAVSVDVLSQIKRLKPKVIYLVGGTGAVGTSVASQLGGIASIRRLEGASRYETSLSISRLLDSSSFAVIATGASFADALPGSGVAGKRSAPVLLVPGRAARLPQNVANELRRLGVQDVLVAGGEGAVSRGIEADLRALGLSVNRSGGPDRYATAAAINRTYFAPGSSDTVFIAAGTGFADALAGAALAGYVGAPLYVTQQACMPAVVAEGIVALSPSKQVVFGGPGAVSEAAAKGSVCGGATKPDPLPPLTSALPSVSGSAVVGGTLTVSPGAWPKGTAFRYQWLRGGQVISGATKASYVVAPVDAGVGISVKVTGSLAGYTDATGVSKEVSISPVLGSTLKLGVSLRAGLSLRSTNGRFSLVQQSDGNLVVYEGQKVLWATGTQGKDSRTVLQSDGNLVTYVGEKAVWATNTVGTSPTGLSMQDDGNLVLYAAGGKVLWSANSRPDRIIPGESIDVGEYLWSKNGRYNLVQQGDGNLVAYDGSKAIWATGTQGAGAKTVLQSDGNLVTYIGGRAVWASNTAGKVATALVMQDDGKVVLYGGGGAVLWASTGVLRGDDYPSNLKNAAKDQIVDPWRFYNRECTSFVAWRLNSVNGVAFHNTMTGPNGVAGQFGNAKNWSANAGRIGYRVDSTPAVGSVAWWPSGTYGHVAWVAQVNADGTVVVEEYNYASDGKYGTRRIAASSVNGFIHIKDM